MQRVKLLKNSKHGTKGMIITLDNNEAFGLIDSGDAMITKDITPDDYINKQEKTNGKPTIVRTDYKS